MGFGFFSSMFFLGLQGTGSYAKTPAIDQSPAFTVIKITRGRPFRHTEGICMMQILSKPAGTSCHQNSRHAAGGGGLALAWGRTKSSLLTTSKTGGDAL